MERLNSQRGQRGQTLTAKGYIRLTSGRHRFKYQHRRVVEELLEEQWHPYLGGAIPAGYVVHHMDYNKQHNCHTNLLLLSACIHDAITADAKPRCPFTGKYISREELLRQSGGDVPDWVWGTYTTEDSASTAILYHAEF